MEEMGDGPKPEQPLSRKKGEVPAPVQPLSEEENTAMTGYFHDGRKRIDIVLVFKDDGNNVIKETRMNFLMNIIQFGLEAEVETGQMLEHQDLIFVKLHAPDAIIEECGPHFNEKSFFKDSHLEYINSIFNIFGVSNERELIKIVRKQYPGPDNYSTLERSNIVYKILLQIPFGKYKNHFGINKLIKNNIILDAFALHDGPYFIVPKQSDVHMNARQVLLIEWLGIVNVWKMQPIHMIHEYFGKRISYFFAFYEYFNFMLIIPWMCGVATISSHFYSTSKQDLFRRLPSLRNELYHKGGVYVDNECRNLTLCPFLEESAYNQEKAILNIIDTPIRSQYAIYICVWGIFFFMPWRYIERYLNWIWEDSRKYKNKLVRPECKEHKMKIEIEKTAKGIKTTKKPSSLLKKFIYVLTAACLGLWVVVMFWFSIVIWHYPRWRRLVEKRNYVKKYGEYEDIAVGAAIYTITVCVIKMVFPALAQIVTRCENNRTFLIHERSIALKLYAFHFVSSFMIFISWTYISAFYRYSERTNFKSVTKMYHYMSGYGFMNSGLGSALDDMSLTLVVMTILEHVIFRMIGFLRKDKTDYPVACDNRAPCWEREYQLKPITEFFFHKRYNALAMQFALITCYSMLFPAAALCLFIINIWDLRHAARQLLLEYRRPLLINTSGPGFWKYLILITALYAPYSNITILIFQSLWFREQYFTLAGFNLYDFTESLYFRYEQSILKKDFLKMWELMRRVKPGLKSPGRIRLGFRLDIEAIVHFERAIRYMFLATIFGIVTFLLLWYILPRTSNSLEDAIKKERRIKNKYQTRRALN